MTAATGAQRARYRAPPRMVVPYDDLVPANRNPPRWDVRADGSVWISHRRLGRADLDRLRDVSHLTMWNVPISEGFLAELAHLRWLDLRGGSAPDLGCLVGSAGLRGLVINQVRGLRDARVIESLTSLELLSLYGLARLETLPDLSRLPRLRRLELGQLRSLDDWAVLPKLNALEELVLHNKLDPDLGVMRELAMHPRLRAFGWWAPDEPITKVRAVTEAVGRPSPKPSRPEQWFAENCRD